MIIAHKKLYKEDKNKNKHKQSLTMKNFLNN